MNKVSDDFLNSLSTVDTVADRQQDPDIRQERYTLHGSCEARLILRDEVRTITLVVGRCVDDVADCVAIL